VKIEQPEPGDVITFLLVAGQYDDTEILGAIPTSADIAAAAAHVLTTQRYHDMSVPRDLVVVRAEPTPTYRARGAKA
jgi:hypothetical protein